MVDKKEILVDSIRKLIELRVPNNEIVMHLHEVGINKAQAKQLIGEAKKPPVKKAPVKEAVPKKVEPAPVPKEIAKKPSAQNVNARRAKLSEISADISKQGNLPDKLPEKKEKLKESFFARLVKKSGKKKAEKPAVKPVEKPPVKPPVKPVVKLVAKPVGNLMIHERQREPEPKPGPKSLVKKPVPPSKPVAVPKPTLERQVQSVDLSKLWEKGILSVVDKNLGEMKEIRKDLDKAIVKEADKIAEKEVKKMQVLFESQQSLFLSKVDAKLESKSKEIEEILDGKISELKKESAGVKNELQLFQAKKIQHDEFMEKLNTELSQLDKTKNTLISEMNSELIKAKSANQEFLDGAQEKVAKLDERVNKTLEVGLDVIDGIKADAETNLKNLVGDKIKALSNNSKDRSGELDDTKRAFEVQIREHMHKLATLEKDLKAKIEKLDKLHGKLESDFDPDTIKQQMGDLEMFKSQFVKVIEINVKKFNASLHKINEQSKWLESQINTRMKLIDAKMKELDAFEENFAKEMGLMVEKGFKKNAAKKKK
jgi:hypothetical protein